MLKENGYYFCDYIDYERFQRSVILRHDIDFLLERALEFAELENYKGIKSTYFVLLSTDFYNVFSKKANGIIKGIIDLGHQIGLHFDEKRYKISNVRELEHWVKREIDILGYAIDKELKVVSMHRPSKWVLENDIQFEGIINSYSKIYMEEFKYLSDSRMHWRENVISIIQSKRYDKLHILAHPFWYLHNEVTMKDKLINFINHSKIERYNSIKDNFRELEKVLGLEEL